MSEWTKTKDALPELYEDVEISYDGKTVTEEALYIEKRTCMLAGSSGGNGYFGAGFATNGSTGCERGLILDEPTHWRYV